MRAETRYHVKTWENTPELERVLFVYGNNDDREVTVITERGQLIGSQLDASYMAARFPTTPEEAIVIAERELILKIHEQKSQLATVRAIASRLIAEVGTKREEQS